MSKLAALAAVLLVLPGVSRAQTSARLQFEVASVKEAAAANEGVRGGCHGVNSVHTAAQQAAAPPLGQCVIRSARLSHLIGIAYNTTMTNLKTGPDWIQRGDLRFDIQAKAEDPTKFTEQQLLTMLQNLLADRFQLKSHTETTEVPGLALSMPKNGLKLKPSESDQTAMQFFGPGGEAVGKPSPDRPISMTARKFSIAALASFLSQLGNGPIVDNTGLMGEYDFRLSWDEKDGPALSTALREQLGLKIDSTKVPVSVLVVDSAQKPTPN